MIKIGEKLGKTARQEKMKKSTTSGETERGEKVLVVMKFKKVDLFECLAWFFAFFVLYSDQQMDITLPVS